MRAEDVVVQESQNGFPGEREVGSGHERQRIKQRAVWACVGDGGEGGERAEEGHRLCDPDELGDDLVDGTLDLVQRRVDVDMRDRELDVDGQKRVSLGDGV